MSLALQKTCSLLLLILIGFLLKNRLIKEDHKKGLKTIILDLALPAMIFVALLKIEVDSELIFLPLLILVWNAVMLIASKLALPLLGFSKNSSETRTWLMMIPSLAPGLSCFPFLMEYLGEDALAWGALADIGNKVYVLIFSYLLAMSWYYRHMGLGSRSNGQKVKELIISMFKEPINMVIIVALVLLGFGLRIENLPGFIGESVLMLKDIMTPLVLLFIGVSVILKWDQIQTIASILLLRAGFSLVLSGLFVTLVDLPSEAAILLAVVFPLSACSFWPFAHMSAIRQMERDKGVETENGTFDLGLGINILAVSLPLSTILILGIFSSGSYFTVPSHLFYIGFGLVFLSVLPRLISWIKNIEVAVSFLEEKKLKDSSAESR
ncbi:AEC family transporter [Algoriphagus pacificus]|uniref:Permease n=1 Tax=Algoriphagus pacificus TaxID=2811234 RepID=A0ABS3CH09_9BACT|nr:permease [Algoriphagus pacificus]MBN7816382.1 permease [Algoriphagus pacificus]